MEEKGLIVNAGKTKICGKAWTSCWVQASFHALFVALEWSATTSSATAASTGCTRNAVGSSAWQRPDYRCPWCLGTACPLDGRPQREVKVGSDKLEVVASFCYLGDMFSAAGGCELSTTTRMKTAWKKFKELLPVLSSHHLSFKTRGYVYSPCVQSTMLHASETWSLTVKPPMFVGEWQGNDQTDLQCQAARHFHHQVQWATCAAWHWGSGPEGERAPLVWTCRML